MALFFVLSTRDFLVELLKNDRVVMQPELQQFHLRILSGPADFAFATIHKATTSSSAIGLVSGEGEV